MAAVTQLASVRNTNSGTKTVTVAPAVNALIVLITFHTGNTSAAAPTDDNADGLGTYSAIRTTVKATSADTMIFWVRNALIGSGASTNFTHAPGTSSGGGISVIQITGMSKAGLAAIIRAGIQGNQAAGGTPAITWTGGGTPQGINPMVGAVFNASNPATLTKPASFDSEQDDGGYNNPTTGIEVVSDDTGNTDATVTWGSTSATAFCTAAVEFDATNGAFPSIARRAQ